VWTYTYTIDIPDFVLPADGASTVNCPADAVAPTPPNVVDACGMSLRLLLVLLHLLQPAKETWSTRSLTPIVLVTATCGTYTYTIDIPDFVLPADGSSTVNCPADAVAPVAPVVVDACGNTITPVAGPCSITGYL
jgi:hypothetical protein